MRADVARGAFGTLAPGEDLPGKEPPGEDMPSAKAPDGHSLTAPPAMSPIGFLEDQEST